MRLDLPYYLATAAGRTAPMVRWVVEGPLVVELEDGGAVAQLEQLPELDGGRLGRLLLRDWGGGAHRYPRTPIPGARLVDSENEIRAEYIPGLRGSRGETGISLVPLTRARYASAMSSSTLTDETLQALLRAGSELL